MYSLFRGIRNQTKTDNILKSGCFGVQAPGDDAEIDRQMRGPDQGYSGKYRDDLTGQPLKDLWIERLAPSSWHTSTQRRFG